MQLHFVNAGRLNSRPSNSTMSSNICSSMTTSTISLANKMTVKISAATLSDRTCSSQTWLDCKRTVGSLTGRFSLMASTGEWKGQANWCFQRAFSTTFSRYCSWLVWRLVREELLISVGPELKMPGAWDEGCPWLLLLPNICTASRPSPILVGWIAGKGTGGGGAGHRSLSLEPGACSTGRAPLIPLHSSLGSLWRKQITVISFLHLQSMPSASDPSL